MNENEFRAFVEVTNPDYLDIELDADNRGRVSLGPEFANKTVHIAVLSVEDSDETTDED